jgi:tRNA 2-thiouridine synthesizing protein A
MKFDKEVDTRGRNCPMPVLIAKRLLGSMNQGEVLRIIASDPNAPADFKKFSLRSGHTLLALEHHENVHHIFVQHTLRPNSTPSN